MQVQFILGTFLGLVFSPINLPLKAATPYDCHIVSQSLLPLPVIKDFEMIIRTDRLGLGYEKGQTDREMLVIMDHRTSVKIGVIWARFHGPKAMLMPLHIFTKGQRFGLEAKYALLKYAFEAVQIDAVYAEINALNTASIRLHEKLGFVRSGTSDGESERYFLKKDKFNEIESRLQSADQRKKFFNLP